jgi:hypothetical protein
MYLDLNHLYIMKTVSELLDDPVSELPSEDLLNKADTDKSIL